jgi:para-nitrobenzyl esterase
MHALEIPFKFNNPDAFTPGQSPFAGNRPERYQAAGNMSTLWANFARSGVPSLPGGPEWPAYDLERRATMMIDAKCQVVDDPTGPEREFWESRPV